MTIIEPPELFDVAARANINARCAHGLLHDLRGSMQALFSAVELLDRSARNNGDRERVDRACDLARRAIHQHEKTVIGAVALLTQQPSDVGTFDLSSLLAEVAHFLHNEAAAKEISIALNVEREVLVCAERSRLQTLLVGLLVAALDAIPTGGTLPVNLSQCGDEVLIRMGSSAGYPSLAAHSGPDVAEALAHLVAGRLDRNDLTLLFARSFLQAGGGRLEIDAAEAPHGSLQIFYPLAGSSRSFAATRASATEK